MALVAAVKNGMMIFDFVNDGPVMLVSKLSDLDLCPIEPVVMATFLSIDVLKLDVGELSLEVVIDEGSDKIEMTLHLSLVNIDLVESVMGMRIWVASLIFVMVMLVVMLMAHLIFNYSTLIEDSAIYIIPTILTYLEFQSSKEKTSIKIDAFFK